MSFRRLEISDGVTTIDLLTNQVGFNLLDWVPSYPAVKNDGVWMDNPLLNGRQLAVRTDANFIDNFTFTLTGQNQSDLARSLHSLIVILDQAVQYWLSYDPRGGATIRKVYLLAQGPEEPAPRYSLVYDYRLPNGLNPFIGNLVQNPPFAEILLTLEHGPWYAAVPGTGECVPSWNDQRERLYNYLYFPVSAENDDCTCNISAGTIELANPVYIQVGGEYSRFSAGLRFQNVTFDASKDIRSVGLMIQHPTGSIEGKINLRIRGELSIQPGEFSTYADWSTRPRTQAYQDFYIDFDAEVPDAWTFTNLGHILEEIMAQPGWQMGNPVVLFLEENGSISGAMAFASYIYSTTHSVEPARFVILLDEPTGGIDESDCLNPTIIQNGCGGGNVGSMKYYDASSGTYSAEIGTPTGGPWTLFPAVPAVDDFLEMTFSGYTGAVKFNLSQGLSGVIGVWEYYKEAGTWATLTVARDFTGGLTAPGENTLHFELPADSRLAACRIRFRINSISGTPIPAIQAADFNVYAPMPYYARLNFEGENLEGATSARARITINPVSGQLTNTDLTMDEVWIGKRSLERGAEFSPVWNFTTFSPLPTGTSSVQSPLIGGTYVYLNHNVVGQMGVGWNVIENPQADDYRGRFRCFLRRYRTAGTENVRWRIGFSTTLQDTSAAAFYTPWVRDTNNPSFDVIDFGAVIIPPASWGNLSGSIPQIYYWVEADILSGTVQAYPMHLIMLPIDEWMARIYQRVSASTPTWVQGVNGVKFRIDGLDENAGLTVFAVDSNNRILYAPMWQMTGNLDLNTLENSAFYFLTGTYKTGNTGYRRRWHPRQAISFLLEYNARFPTLRPS